MNKKSLLLRIVEILFIILVLLWLVPLVFGIFTSLKSNNEALAYGYKLLPNEWTIESYIDTLTNRSYPVMRWVVNSVVVSTVHVGLALIVASLASYGYCFVEYRFKGAMLALLAASLMIPAVANLIPLYKIMDGLGLINTLMALILPGLGAAFATILMYNYLRDVPYELMEAATIDGATHWEIYRKIMLPIMRPILTVAGLFCFLGSWNDFFWPTIAINDKNHLTITAGLRLINGEYGLEPANLLAAAVISALPVAILYIVAQKQFMSGMSMNSGIK